MKVAMPLLVLAHKQSFDPKTVKLLAEAFDAAWEVLLTEGVVMSDVQEARRTLAQQIIELAHNGERDPRKLRLVALDRFLHMDRSG
jgi:hypothetical protein